MLFCVPCSNAFQLRSDPEVLFTLPSWSSCRGQSVITPPTPPSSRPTGLHRKQNRTTEVKEKQAGRSLVSGPQDQTRAGTVHRLLRFRKLRKTTKPFLTSFSPQNAVSCLTTRTRALANRTNNKFLDTPAKQHLSL